jgi:hypothetical protein
MGVEVGFLIPSVPFLHPDTWKGQGISLQNAGINRTSIEPVNKQLVKTT